MGNAPITLGIKIDGDHGSEIPTPVAGGCLSGMVFADIPSTAKATSVVLELRGEEIARSKHGAKKYAIRPIVTLQLQLRTFPNQKIERGKYEFPFAIDLPASLPSSVRVYKSSSSWCEVKYVLRAIIVGVKAGKNTVSQRALHVQSAPLPPLLYPVMVEPVTKQITNALGSSKGSITFGVRVSNTHIGRGEDLELRLACRNDSTVSVDRVQAKVKEKVEWMGSKESTKEDILVNPSIVPDAEGLGKKSRSELKEKKKAGVDDNYLDIFGEITSSSDEKLIKLRIPATSRDTFKGQVVSVKHLLVIKIKTKWGVDDTKIEIPLKVGSRAVDEAHEPTVRLPPPVPLPPPSGEDDSENPQPIPVPVAIPIGWAASEKSLRIIAPQDAIVVGGTAFDSSDTGEAGLSDPVVPVPSPKPPDLFTLDNLLAEMVSSVKDYDLISAKLEDPDWEGLFSSLSAEDFGSILAHVNQDYDEPRVAALIAPVVGDGVFSCNHCVAALKACAEWNRIAVVQELLPFISDLSSGRAAIESELTPWEKIVTSKDFERASSHS